MSLALNNWADDKMELLTVKGKCDKELYGLTFKWKRVFIYLINLNNWWNFFTHVRELWFDIWWSLPMIKFDENIILLRISYFKGQAYTNSHSFDKRVKIIVYRHACAHTHARTHTHTQGPVGQSIISLTGSLVVKMLTVLLSTIIPQVFFCCQNVIFKSYSQFSYHIIIGFLINVQVQGQLPHQWAPFSAKLLAYMPYLVISFNDALNNNIISFEQLGPGILWSY